MGRTRRGLQLPEELLERRVRAEAVLPAVSRSRGSRLRFRSGSMWRLFTYGSCCRRGAGAPGLSAALQAAA